MKKILLLTAFLLSITLFGENSYILWKIEGPQSTVYLAPTVHLLSDDFYPLNSEVERIFSESDTLAVEIDMSKKENSELIMTQGLKYMYNKDFKELNHLISEDNYAVVSKAFEDRGVDLKNIEMLSPFFLSATLLKLELEQRGYKSKIGLDMYFINKANKLNKEIIALEESLYQFQLIDTIDKTYLLESLINSCTGRVLDESVTSLEKLVETIQRGDLEGFEDIYHTMVTATPADEKIYEKLLYERNIKMADKIIAFLKGKGTYFVAVGGGHYIGKGNIRELVEAKGYKVERVDLD